MGVFQDKAMAWAEQGRVPDFIIRAGIRGMLRQRLAQSHVDDCELAAMEQYEMVERMRQSPVALVPELANEQHYELPVGFLPRCSAGT